MYIVQVSITAMDRTVESYKILDPEINIIQ